MTSPAELAKVVAEALGLREHIGADGHRYWEDDEAVLEEDGDMYGVTDPYWQVRCRDWLRENDYCVIIPGKSDNLMECYPEFQRPNDPGYKAFMSTTCPTAEFYARAIWHLSQARGGE